MNGLQFLAEDQLVSLAGPTYFASESEESDSGASPVSADDDDRQEMPVAPFGLE